MPVAKTKGGGKKPKSEDQLNDPTPPTAAFLSQLNQQYFQQQLNRQFIQQQRQLHRERRQERREDRREARQDARMEQRRENRQERRQERREARQDEPKASPASWEQKTSKPAGGGGGGGGGATNPVAAGSPTFQEMRGQSLEELVRGGRKGQRQRSRRGVE